MVIDFRKGADVKQIAKCIVNSSCWCAVNLEMAHSMTHSFSGETETSLARPLKNTAVVCLRVSNVTLLRTYNSLMTGNFTGNTAFLFIAG